jgi:ribulose-phosphate 3-epimerase
MNTIIPAILPQSRADLDQSLARLVSMDRIQTVQIDIVDGIFATPKTWPYTSTVPWELPLTERFRYDIDLMVVDPDTAIDHFVALGAARITLHAESTPSLLHTLATFHTRYGHATGFTPDLLSLGLAISMNTPLSLIEPYLDHVDYVQLMGIARIGHQGEAFDARVLPKLRALRSKHRSLVIQIDGGVTEKSAPLLLAAGASRLVVGSALERAPDISKAFEAFETLCGQYGLYE